MKSKIIILIALLTAGAGLVTAQTSSRQDTLHFDRVKVARIKAVRHFLTKAVDRDIYLSSITLVKPGGKDSLTLRYQGQFPVPGTKGKLLFFDSSFKMRLVEGKVYTIRLHRACITTIPQDTWIALTAEPDPANCARYSPHAMVKPFDLNLIRRFHPYVEYRGEVYRLFVTELPNNKPPLK